MKKTVYLFISTVGDILQDERRFFDRIRTIINLCDLVRDSVIIWRPHPLTESVFHSMRPDLREKYDSLVMMFKSKENGIFDETADYQRAIGMADAYIGSLKSSVAKVFRTTGKPMFVINCRFDEMEDGMIFPGTVSAAVYQKKAYMFSAWFNGLFTVDLENGAAAFQCALECRQEEREFLYQGALVHDEKIYFLPCVASDLAVYDLNTKEVELLPLPSRRTGVLGSLIQGDDLYLFPEHLSESIDVVHLKNHGVEKRRLYNWERSSLEPEHRFFGCQLHDGCVWRACYSKPLIQCCDLASGQTAYYEIDCGNKGFMDLAWDGDDLWLLSLEYEALVIWNRETRRTKTIIEFPEKLRARKTGVPFLKIVPVDSCMWLVPRDADFLVKINSSDKSMECVDFQIHGLKSHVSPDSFFGGYQIVDHFLHLFPSGGNMILCVDTVDSHVTGIPIGYDASRWNEGGPYSLEQRIAYSPKGCVYSEAFCSLKRFFAITGEGKTGREEERNGPPAGKTIGSGIWECVKKRAAGKEKR